MKYTKQIVFFIFLNIIIVFLSIFTGNLTRKFEVANLHILKNIEKQKEQFVINQIEYSIYNNPNYLKKLHNIYFSIEENYPEKKIVSLSNISNFEKENHLLVNIKSK
tara:strand:+ start:10435 stop:10755 length:321 start_codon:yes stop_codon:yes gene_type:complete